MKKIISKLTNLAGSVLTYLIPAETLRLYIRKAKLRGIREVDVDVGVLSGPDLYEISLTPSLTPTWSSSTISIVGAEQLFGRRKAKYMQSKKLYSELKRRGLEEAVEIAEKLKKEGFDVVVEGKLINNIKENLEKRF